MLSVSKEGSVIMGTLEFKDKELVSYQHIQRCITSVSDSNPEAQTEDILRVQLLGRC